MLCKGCEEEYEQMIDYVNRGFHVATTKERNLFENKHLSILIVDDEGRVVCESVKIKSK